MALNKLEGIHCVSITTSASVAIDKFCSGVVRAHKKCGRPGSNSDSQSRNWRRQLDETVADCSLGSIYKAD